MFFVGFIPSFYKYFGTDLCDSIFIKYHVIMNAKWRKSYIELVRTYEIFEDNLKRSYKFRDMTPLDHPLISEHLDRTNLLVTRMDEREFIVLI